MHVLGVACRRPPVNRRVVAVDKLVDARHSNTIADLDKVGISRIEGIYAPANVRSHFLCTIRKDHCTTSGFHSTASNGDFTTCAAAGTSPCASATAANASAATITFFRGVAVATDGGHCSTVNRDYITTTILTAANTSTAAFSANGVYFAFGDCDFTAIALIAATDTSPLLRTNRCYIAAFNGDSCTVLCATTDSRTVISCTAIRHHCTTSNGDDATIAIRAAANGGTISCYSCIFAGRNNITTVDSDFTAITTITSKTRTVVTATTDASAATLS